MRVITVRLQHQDGIDALLVGKCLNGGQIRLRGGDQYAKSGTTWGTAPATLTARRMETATSPATLTDEHGMQRRMPPGGAMSRMRRHNSRGLRTHNAAGHYPGTGLAAACANPTASRGASAY